MGLGKGGGSRGPCGGARRQRRMCIGACEWWLVPEESLSDVTYSPGPEETWHGGAESVTFGVAWPGFQTFPLNALCGPGQVSWPL